MSWIRRIAEHKTKLGQEIDSLFKEGRLLAHVMEFPLMREPTEKQINFFNVLAGAKDSHYEDKFRIIDGDKNQGYPGMALTVLKEDFSPRLWDQESQVGLFFSANDTNYVKPLLLTSGGCFSKVHDNKLHALYTDIFPQVRARQGFSNSGPIEIDLKGDNEQYRQNIYAALDIMWDSIAKKGRHKYLLETEKHNDIAGANEFNANVKLRGLLGIFVNERPPDIKGFKPNPIYLYQQSVHSANKLAHWISEQYPDIFPTPPKIFSYYPNEYMKKGYIRELTPEQIKHPNLESAKFATRVKTGILEKIGLGY